MTLHNNRYAMKRDEFTALYQYRTGKRLLMVFLQLRQDMDGNQHINTNDIAMELERSGHPDTAEYFRDLPLLGHGVGIIEFGGVLHPLD